MSRFLLVNPRSLSNEELSDLITDLSRIKSQRSKLCSVSSLNEICIKRGGKIEYDFERTHYTNRWTCYALFTLDNLCIKKKHQHHEKKIAKEYVAAKVLEELQQLLFGNKKEKTDNEKEYPGDSLPTDENYWSWNKMTDSEKKKILDEEIDEYMNMRGIDFRELMI
jgi:hypothetical protein